MNARAGMAGGGDATALVKSWDVAAKVDPDKYLSDVLLQRVLRAGFDGIIVGGTQGITREKTLGLVRRVCGHGVPVAVEVSTPDAIIPGPDVYLVPLVLNSPSTQWIVGRHQAVLAQLQPPVEWSRVMAEGYIVTNPDSAVARLTGATRPLERRDVVSYVCVAVRLMRLPIVYIESSGSFGDPDLLTAAAAEKGDRLLFYGGGIDSPEKAARVAVSADCVVIGNALYDPQVKLSEIVRAARGDVVVG